MPRLDGTGPLGEGSRTGRVLGNCVPKDNQKNEQTINNKNRKHINGRKFQNKSR